MRGEEEVLYTHLCALDGWYIDVAPFAGLSSDRRLYPVAVIATFSSQKAYLTL